MKAADVMTREFETIHPDALLQEIAPRFQNPDADPIPVCENQRLIGMIDHSDIGPHLGADRFSIRKIRVRDVLAPEILYCFENTDVTEASTLMRENNARLVPVLDAEMRLVGILTFDQIGSRSHGYPPRSGFAVA